MKHRLIRWLVGGPYMRLPDSEKEAVYLVTVMDYGRSYFSVRATTMKLELTTSIGEGRRGTFEGTVG